MLRSRLVKVTALFILILVVGCQEPLEKDEFILTGEISGMINGEFYAYGKEALDTIKVKNGEFEYHHRMELPANTFFTFDPNDGSIETTFSLFLESARMELSVSADDPSTAKLTGSKTHDQSEALDLRKEVVAQKYQAERDALSAVGEKYDAAARAGASEEVLNAIKDEDNTIREQLEPYLDEVRALDVEFIKENPDSYVGLYNARFIFGSLNYEVAADLFNRFADELKATEMGIELAKELADIKSGSPGSPAKNISAKDINGEQFELSALKGQYVLIDFWASWCVPCRKGNPHLLQLYAKYKSKGFEILGVSDDDSRPEAWRKAVDKDQIGVWKHVLRGLQRIDNRYVFDNDINAGYGISSLPTKILVDPDGVIIGRYGPGGSEPEELDGKLEEIFGF